uniref:MICOS complex subunit MIC13 n=1 Tax=Poecilia reticulata TaxID=8081 RepID=A0A3P9NR24_POERE
MASRIWPLVKLVSKVTIAGGAVYVTYDSGLLGSSEQGSVVLEKAKVAVPPALEEWIKYFGLEVRMCKLLIWPITWYLGVRWTISSLSEAPTRASEYTSQGLQYVKDLIK